MVTKVQVIEQRNRAIGNLQEAINAYRTALNSYRETPTSRNMQRLKDAYGKLSSAQWEVEQWPMADQE